MVKIVLVNQVLERRIIGAKTWNFIEKVTKEIEINEWELILGDGVGAVVGGSHCESVDYCRFDSFEMFLNEKLISSI